MAVRRVKGMFGGWDELGHYIPEDDWVHKKDLSCGCHPEVVAQKGIGAIVAHKFVKADDIPDTLPEDFAA